MADVYLDVVLSAHKGRQGWGVGHAPSGYNSNYDFNVLSTALDHLRMIKLRQE